MATIPRQQFMTTVVGITDIVLRLELHDLLRIERLTGTMCGTGKDLMDTVRIWAPLTEKREGYSGVGVIVYSPDLPLGKKDPAHMLEYDEIATRLGLHEMYGGIYAIMRTREYRIDTKYVAFVDSPDFGEALIRERLAHAYFGRDAIPGLPSLVRQVLSR